MFLTSITVCCLLLTVQSQDAFLSPYLNPDLLYFSDNVPKVAPLSVLPITSNGQNQAIKRENTEQENNKKQSTSVEIERSAEVAYATVVEQAPNEDKQNMGSREVSGSTTPTKETTQQLAKERQNSSPPQDKQIVSERARYWSDISLTRPSVNIPESALDMSQRRPNVPQGLKLQQNTQGVPNMSEALRPEIKLGKPTVAIPASELERPFDDFQGDSPSQASISKEPAKSSSYNSLLYSVTNFGVNLLKNIDATNPGNVVVSPYSITTLLALLQQGAWGQTQEQIANALRMTSESSASAYAQITRDIDYRNSRNVLKVANNVYVAESFIINQDFKKTAVRSFNSDITPLSFIKSDEAARQINSWVASKTDNKIERLISPASLGSTTQVVLVNAIYFKGLWEVPFRVESTTPREFLLSSGQTKTAQYMRMRKMFKTGMDPATNANIILLPFERDEYYLMVILPSQFMGMKDTLSSLTDARLLSYLSFSSMDTELELPRFTARADTDLKEVLGKMGITNMFGRYAELNGVGSFRAYSPQISSAVHSAVLSIDEKGGSAAAATAFAAVALSYDEPAVVFKVNRPFIAVIWDSKTSLPLFMAKIEDPQQ